MDGEVIIGTSLNTKQLEKDLKVAKKELQQYEQDAERLTKQKAKAEIDLEPYREQKRLIEETTNEELQYAQTKKEVERILENENNALQGLNEKYSNQLSNLSEIEQKIKNNAAAQQVVNDKIDNLNVKLKQAKTFGGIRESIENIGNSITKVTKKIARWTLAIIGIRGAYMAVRNAINAISQQDEQLAANIQYMKNALAYALEPIVRRIVEWMKQIMYYVGYITKAWFGRNIFENANKSLKGATKSAKELKKQLSGFDEMNILSDSSSASGSGTIAPDFDLTKFEGERPWWLDWLAKNGETIKKVLLDIGLAIAALKIGKLIQELGILGNLPLWAKVAAIFLILHGAKTIYEGITKFIENPSWDSFLQTIQGIAEVVAGFALLFGGWKLAVIALGIALVTYIIRNWDKIKEKMDKFKQWINDKFIQPIKDKFNQLPEWAKGLARAIAYPIITMLNFLIDALNTFLLPFRAAIAVIGKITGKGWTLDSVKIPKIPYFAKGAIINQPSRGVPVGGGIGGERGAEGVIPLTDSQQMALLGESIGKYVNINATIPVYVGNRQIAREIRKINAEDDFAFNR